jgi:hypothetical protein
MFDCHDTLRSYLRHRRRSVRPPLPPPGGNHSNNARSPSSEVRRSNISRRHSRGLDDDGETDVSGSDASLLDCDCNIDGASAYFEDCGDAHEQWTVLFQGVGDDDVAAAAAAARCGEQCNAGPLLPQPSPMVLHSDNRRSRGRRSANETATPEHQRRRQVWKRA